MSIATLYIEKKKMLVPQLRFREFDDDWKIKKFSVLLKEGRLGGNYENSESNVGIPVIKMGNLGRGEININRIQFLPGNSEYNNGDILEKGDLLFNTRNTLELVGKVSIWREELPFALYNSNIMRMKFNDEIESSNTFMNYNFNTRNSINQLRRFATGTTSVAAIYGKDLKAFNVTFPTLREQEKIASFLSAVDEKIQQLSRTKELLEQYKKGVMQQLFSGKLRFKDKNGEDYPDWEKVNGNILFESISNKKHNSDLPILAITQDQGAIPRDLIDYKVSVTDKSVDSYKVVEIGDFVISLRSFQGGIEYSNYRGICSPAYIILRPTSDKVNKIFYKTYLKTSSYIKELQKNLEGIRDGKMISYKYFSDIKLPFPSFEEQQKIANFLSSIDAKIENVNRQIIQTQTFKKGLLQQMFV